MVRSRDGDELAFEELVRACERRVVTIAYQITGNLHDAQDVAQESFLSVYRARDRFQDGRSFEAWLYRIVVNQARKSLARSRRLRTDALDDETAAAIPAEGTPSPLEAAAAESQSAALMRLLERLSPRLRSVFVLRDLQGMETSEIARILSCAEATVRRHSAEARIRLRRLMEEQGRPAVMPATRREPSR